MSKLHTSGLASGSSCLWRDLGHMQLQPGVQGPGPPRSLLDGMGFETLLVSARRPHVLGSAGSQVPRGTPHVHSEQEGAFPQSVHVVMPGAAERVSAVPRHVSTGRAPLSQPVSPSSSTLVVSHLHVDSTCGGEVRAHRRLSGLPAPGGRSPRTQPLTQHLSGASRCPMH